MSSRLGQCCGPTDCGAFVEQQIHQGQRRGGLLDLARGSVACGRPERDRRYELTRRADSLLLPKWGDNMRRFPGQHVMQLYPSAGSDGPLIERAKAMLPGSAHISLNQVVPWVMPVAWIASSSSVS